MGFPHAVQNRLPEGTEAPQERHRAFFRALPQEEQKFPDPSAPHAGHFIVLRTPDQTPVPSSPMGG
jgi:hypothetical protein